MFYFIFLSLILSFINPQSTISQCVHSTWKSRRQVKLVCELTPSALSIFAELVWTVDVFTTHQCSTSDSSHPNA